MQLTSTYFVEKSSVLGIHRSKKNDITYLGPLVGYWVEVLHTIGPLMLGLTTHHKGMS